MGKMRTCARSFLLAAAGASVLWTGPARAHCDGLDGPVVKAAQQALATGNPDPVLIWVRKADEPQVRTAFAQAVKVRALNAAARSLADTYFFETVVRLHRAGEGVAFTGLKPSGRDLGPAIPAADLALATGNPDALLRLLDEKTRAGLREHFRKVSAGKSFRPGDVAAGRAHVDAYVRYIHYVEGLYEAATSPAVGHYPEEAGPAHREQ